MQYPSISIYFSVYLNDSYIWKTRISYFIPYDQITSQVGVRGESSGEISGESLDDSAGNSEAIFQVIDQVRSELSPEISP